MYAASVSPAAAGGHGWGGRLRPVPGSKVKLFDSADGTGFGAVTSIQNFADATLVKHDRRWHMIGASCDLLSDRIELFSASLPAGAPLSATGWTIDTAAGDPTTARYVTPRSPEGAWDRLGGRHCPSYVRGWTRRSTAAGTAGTSASTTPGRP